MDDQHGFNLKWFLQINYEKQIQLTEKSDQVKHGMIFKKPDLW